MARTQVRTLWLMAAVALPILVAAQWGVQGSFLHYETLYKGGMMNLVFGVSHNQSERSGWAIDANVGYSAVSPYALISGDGNSFEQNGFNYTWQAFNYGLTYRSMYFLADNDNNATFYLGPFLGVRRVTSTADGYQFTGSYSNAQDRIYKDSNVIFPVGLRIGWRGGLEGFVGDLYLGLGYNAGSMEKVAYLEDRHQLRRFFLQVGYSFGAGWE